MNCFQKSEVLNVVEGARFNGLQVSKEVSELLVQFAEALEFDGLGHLLFKSRDVLADVALRLEYPKLRSLI